MIPIFPFKSVLFRKPRTLSKSSGATRSDRAYGSNRLSSVFSHSFSLSFTLINSPKKGRFDIETSVSFAIISLSLISSLGILLSLCSKLASSSLIWVISLSIKAIVLIISSLFFSLSIFSSSYLSIREGVSFLILKKSSLVFSKDKETELDFNLNKIF